MAAEPADVAIVLLGGAIRVRQCSYSVRRAWLKACLLYHLRLRWWRDSGAAVWFQGGGGSPWVVMGRWSSTGI